MGRAPCCDKANVKRGPWSPEEDSKLKDFIEKYGTGGNWIALPQKAGLKRCGKSCRLRWLNYLRPNIKHGDFSEEEDRIICTLFASIGSRWSIIAAHLPGRTDNDIKNYWNTKLKKKLLAIANINNTNNNPLTHKKISQPLQTPPPNSQILSYFNPMTSLPPNYPISHNNYQNYNFTPSLLQITQESLSLFKQPFLFDQASCSSSDGSGSHGKEIKQEENMGFQSYISNGFEENHKFMLDFGNYNSGGEGYFGNCGTTHPPPLEYDVEEVKQQLIISNNNSTTTSTSDHLFLFNDGETKIPQEIRTMYYNNNTTSSYY